jgi:folate-binding protein YgfZ
MHNLKSHTPESTAPLPGLVKVKGLDSQKFLQGQLTCDVEQITETQSLLGAHCNPQGRVLFLFRLFYWLDAYYLVLPRTMVIPALTFLKKYAVFFKLTLHDASEEQEAEALHEKAAQEWKYFDLSKGIPQIYPETSGLFLPHDLNLHELQGLSWDKGCYTGQEIIARMHYRGKLKNHLYQAKIQTAAIPHLGAEVYCLSEGAPLACGFIVDYREVSYNLYEALILTHEAKRSEALQIDPQQNETWEWLR